MSQRVVITGGPGVGKTTLLTALAARGSDVVPETARAIIQDRKRRHLTPRPDPAEFANGILRIDLERYESATSNTERIFFDRGILDALCMLDQLGMLTPEDARRYVSDYPYFRRVFVAPPWEQIYKTDNERDQTFAECVRAHETLCRWYAKCGYEIVQVPRSSTEERCDFVLQALNP